MDFQRFERAVIEGKLAHGCNPVAAWMVSHCSVDSDPAGNIKPNKAPGKRRLRIDGKVYDIDDTPKLAKSTSAPSLGALPFGCSACSGLTSTQAMSRRVRSTRSVFSDISASV